MAREMLYPDETPMVHRHSSLGQYRGFLSVVTRGGFTPIKFDQLDGITCDRVQSHPVIISFGGDIGYHFPDGECSYASDKFIHFDRETTELVPLPACMGGGGEFYERFLKNNSFVNFGNDTSLGVHNEKTLRVGLSYVLSDETLPAE